jgi:integrase
VQNWLGHADIKTTMVYLRFRSQATDAALLAEAFAEGTTPQPADVPAP